MTTQRYKPITEDEIRALVQERIKKRSFQPRYSHARWDEMRYLPTDKDDFPIDSEHFAKKAAFAVALTLALEGQKPEPLERYRVDWKPGARTYVSERRRWRARWPWAPHGPCMITRLNDKGKEIRLGPDLSKYLWEDDPPKPWSLIAPPEPTQMIVPPEGDTYSFDWHLERATKELVGLRKVRRAMKKRARLTDRYVTWVFADGQWRGHTLANPQDFLGLEGVRIKFTGYPDESPIPTNQYPALKRFPDTEEYGPWKGVEPLPIGGEVLKGVEARRQDFLTLFGEWREGEPLRTAEVLSPDFRVLSGGWRRGRCLELGPPTIPANIFDTDPKLAMFWAKRLDVSKHPVLDVNWKWRLAGVREALYDPARKSRSLSKKSKHQINRAHYLNGLMALTPHQAWEQIAPLLPENGRRGRQWENHRKIINGILWRLRTGAPWQDLPPRYGPWQTCYDRFVRWRRDGTWDRLLSRAQTKSDAVGELEWELSVDATIARAHQHAAGARREASQQDAKRGLKTPKKRRLGGAAED